MLDVITSVLTSAEFAQFVVNLLLAAIAVIVPLVGSAVRGFIAANKNSRELETLAGIAKVAVLAAEQSGLSGLIEDKKNYAIRVAEQMLEERGIKIDLDTLTAAIEAAVLNELNYPLVQNTAYQKVANNQF